MKPPRQLCVPKGVVSQTLDKEMVLLNLQSGVYWSLNETGALIWAEIAQHGNRQRIIEALQEKFMATESELRAAADGLVEDLIREGLLEPAHK